MSNNSIKYCLACKSNHNEAYDDLRVLKNYLKDPKTSVADIVAAIRSLGEYGLLEAEFRQWAEREINGYYDLNVEIADERRIKIDKCSAETDCVAIAEPRQRRNVPLESSYIKHQVSHGALERDEQGVWLKCKLPVGKLECNLKSSGGIRIASGDSWTDHDPIFGSFGRDYKQVEYFASYGDVASCLETIRGKCRDVKIKVACSSDGSEEFISIGRLQLPEKERYVVVTIENSSDVHVEIDSRNVKECDGTAKSISTGDVREDSKGLLAILKNPMIWIPLLLIVGSLVAFWIYRTTAVSYEFGDTKVKVKMDR